MGWGRLRREKVLDSPGFEGEEGPSFAIMVDGVGVDRSACECVYSIRPEMQRGCVSVHDADFPGAGEALPDLMRRVGANSTPAVSAKDEELRHVPGGLAACELRALLYQCEAGELAFVSDQEGMPAGLGPVERKRRIAESAIFADFEIDNLAEVVCVELEQA